MSIITRLFIIQSILTVFVVIFFYLTIVNIDRSASDEYFIGNFNIASLIFVTYTLFFSSVYYLMSQRLNKKLGLIHFILGLPIFIVTFIEQLGFYCHDPVPRRYFTSATSKLLDIFPIYSSVIYQNTIFLLAFGIGVFIINLIFNFGKTVEHS